MLAHVILGLLRDGRASHGYELAAAYQRRAGIRLSSGSFYRELGRLSGEGLVHLNTNPPGTDPRRLPYAISDHGRWVFDNWLGFPTPDDDLPSRLLFIEFLSPGLRLQLFEQWTLELRRRLEQLTTARGRASDRRDALPGGARHDVLPLLLSRRVYQLQAELDFLAEFRAAVTCWGATPPVASPRPDAAAAPAAPA